MDDKRLNDLRNFTEDVLELRQKMKVLGIEENVNIDFRDDGYLNINFNISGTDMNICRLESRGKIIATEKREL